MSRISDIVPEIPMMGTSSVRVMVVGRGDQMLLYLYPVEIPLVYPGLYFVCEVCLYIARDVCTVNWELVCMCCR